MNRPAPHDDTLPPPDGLDGGVRPDAAATVTVPVPVDSGDDGDGGVPDQFPCSIAQERFWLLDRIAPGNPALNVAFRWQLRGHVDAPRLEQAWLRLIARHEVLRTVFREVDGRPVQDVRPHTPFRMATIDLASRPEDERDAEGERIAIIEARAPFDLGEGPLIRATLLRRSAGESVLLVTSHQIVTDGWSMGLIARELGSFYRALTEGREPALDELPLQYGDFSEWQLAFTRERGMATEEAYWSRQLDGLRPFKIPPDKPPPRVPSAQGAVAVRTLPEAVTRRAQAIGGEFGATLFATALAALATVLHRYTAETEIVIGMLVSDRDQVELEGLVGQFVNALILRNDLSGDPAFGTLIQRLRDTSAAALEHKHIPIERLLSLAGGSRRDGEAALISVNFIFQRSFIEDADYGDFRLADLPALPSDTMYDLNFSMVEDSDGWQLACHFSSDQYERDTVERLLHYIETILDRGCREPQRRLSEIPMLDDDERRRLQADGPDQQSFPTLRGLLARFATQVVERHDAVAVSCGDRALSYADLDDTASRLAGYLRSRGIGTGTRVALCLPRGIEMPVTMLALLRLGASWIALDPTETRSRLGLLIETSRISLVITLGTLASLLPGSATARIELDTEADAVDQAEPPPPVLATPDSEACALAFPTAPGRTTVYRVSHAALETALMALATRPGLGAGETMLATTPFTLDAALIELLLPLLVGARVDIADEAGCTEPTRLLQRLGQLRNPVLLATARRHGQLIAAGWSPALRVRAWCHGERLGIPLARRLIARCTEVWTLYSAPGAAICSALHFLDKAEDVAILGRATPGSQLRVLDDLRHLLPTGAVGELHIGGVSLLLGAGSDAALVDRLVPAPDAGAAGPRMLRTGDRARIRADGLVELLGRKDRALRVDGHWVEPGEIETQLARHPNVAEAAVDAVIDPADADGAPTLTAWIVLTGAGSGEGIAEVLAAGFVKQLPPHLLPRRYMFVDSVPRHPDGQINFARLRRSGRADGAAGPSATPAESRIMRLWSELLGRDGITVDDNFFELGGHSLLAARMLRRIEAEFGRRVGLAALFRAPTVAALARLLDSQDVRDFDFRQVVKLQPNGSRPPMIAINNTGIYYTLAKRLGQDQPVTSLQLFDPGVGLDAMPKSIEEIAALYVQLIRRVQPQGPYLLMGWCVAGALAFEVARQLQVAGAEVANLYLMDAWVPNHLRQLQPLRRFINDRSLRLKYTWDDFTAKWARGRSLHAFLANRTFYKRLQRLFRRGAAEPGSTLEHHRDAEPAGYDRWLLDYLQDLSSRYEPKPYDGRITLFRSVREPTGLWFDPFAGWRRYARRGIALHIVEGDHFSMFQEPGASQMAAIINAGS